MISKEDRMFFIDPLQPAKVRRTSATGEPLPLRIVALKYRRSGWKSDRVGTVIDVTHQRIDSGDLWWVDSDGDYVQGAQVADRVAGRGNCMTIINDDLFLVGRNGGEHGLQGGGYGCVMLDARRSDGKRPIGNPDRAMSYLTKSVFKAAPWAHELMPAEGDSEEVVTAKVARAKQKYIQRSKKAEIYREGMRRDWLHHLDTLRTDHDMPTPTFAVGVEGTFIASAGDFVAVDTLTNIQRERIEPIGRNAVVRPTGGPREGFAQSFIGRPFAAVLEHTASTLNGIQSISVGDIRYGVFDALGVHGGHVLESTRTPVLVNF